MMDAGMDQRKYDLGARVVLFALLMTLPVSMGFLSPAAAVYGASHAVAAAVDSPAKSDVPPAPPTEVPSL